MTQISDSTQWYSRHKAVSVVASGGFLCQSAPTFKPRARPVLILLTYKQRITLDCLIRFDDQRYQAKYDGALPAGYKSIRTNGQGKYRYMDPAIGWTNAENQWYDAAALAGWLNARAAGQQDDLTVGACMVIELINMAAGNEQVFSQNAVNLPDLAAA
jgi:hypothetical protein